MPHLVLTDRMEWIASQIVDAALKIHRTLGPGLLESVYERCLAYELAHRGLNIETQVALDIVYEELRIENGLRIDLLVEDCIIIEVESVEKTSDLHKAQLLTYLRLANLRLGFLINFNVPLIKDGITRVIN
jgi:GxxExxY protein